MEVDRESTEKWELSIFYTQKSKQKKTGWQVGNRTGQAQVFFFLGMPCLLFLPCESWPSEHHLNFWTRLTFSRTFSLAWFVGWKDPRHVTLTPSVSSSNMPCLSVNYWILFWLPHWIIYFLKAEMVPTPVLSIDTTSSINIWQTTASRSKREGGFEKKQWWTEIIHSVGISSIDGNVWFKVRSH